ncbi:MAG: EI24 domain-containing protein [Bdellovibrionota bacterium]
MPNISSIVSPVTEIARGAKTYLSGASWLKNHPKYLLLVFIPMVLGLIALISAWTFFIQYDDVILNWALFTKPESWWGVGLYYLMKTLVYISFILLGFASSILVMNILASPIYEYISMVVEADLTHKKAPELSFIHSLKLMGEEFKKVAFILFLSIILLLIPGVNIISTIITAFLISWDFYDYSLLRRGWSFKDRLSFVKKDFWAVTGLGLWLLIPLIQFILMPLAIAGGTMLSVKALQKHNLLEKGMANAHR